MNLTYARPFSPIGEGASHLGLVNLHDTKHIQLASSLDCLHSMKRWRGMYGVLVNPNDEEKTPASLNYPCRSATPPRLCHSVYRPQMLM